MGFLREPREFGNQAWISMLAIIFTAQANIIATTCLSSVIEIKVWYLDQ